jgi:hypothetical protein
MATLFDIVTVACFVGLVIAFFQFTDRERGTLLRFVLAGIVFAVANQVGNNGFFFFATILVLAGIGYSVLVARS